VEGEAKGSFYIEPLSADTSRSIGRSVHQQECLTPPVVFSTNGYASLQHWDTPLGVAHLLGPHN